MGILSIVFGLSVVKAQVCEENITVFNDSSSAVNLTFLEAGNQSVYVDVYGIYDIQNAQLNVSGYKTPSWVFNNTIISGLTDLGTTAVPDIATYDGHINMIAGDWDGTFTGFTWNGTGWSSNSTLVAGLGDLGTSSNPAFWLYDGNVNLLAGEGWTGGGWDNSWTWNGTYWIDNATLRAGLSSPTCCGYSPDIYEIDGQWHIIYGSDNEPPYAFTWNGTRWLRNTTMEGGIVGNAYTDPAIFTYDGEIHLLAGRDGGPCDCCGCVYGYTWNGSGWDQNTTWELGTIDQGDYSSPVVYEIDGQLHLISGKYGGTWDGFTWDGNYTVSPYIDIGDDGDNEWSYGGLFSQEDNRTSDFNEEINDYLASCDLVDNYCTIPFLVHSDSHGVIELSDMDIEHYYILNLTFDDTVNATIMHSEGGNMSENIESIYYKACDLGEGKISVTFNSDYQLIEWMNDYEESLNEEVHVTGTPDKVQAFTVWDRYEPIEDANVKIYELTGEDEFMLIWASFTELQGEGSANLVSGKEYRFVIEEDGYEDFTQDRYIVPGTDDTLNFVLIGTGEGLPTIIPYTDCLSVMLVNESCRVYVESDESMASVVFQYRINDTGIQTSQWTNVLEASLLVNVSHINQNWTVNVTVNGVLIGSWQVRYEPIEEREIQIGIIEGLDPSSHFLLFTILIQVVAGGIAGFGNKLVKGSGVFVFGIVVSIFSVVIGNAYLIGVGIAVVVISAVARKII